jgi:hypothetical protein
LGLETGDRLAFGKNERGEIVLRKANLDTFDRLQNLTKAQTQTGRSGSTKPASQKQIQKLTIEAEKRGLTEKWIHAWIDYFYKKQSRKELTSAEASEMIDKFMQLNDGELQKILTKIKEHYQPPQTAQDEKTVYNVDPETGEIIDDDELDEILSRANGGEL